MVNTIALAIEDVGKLKLASIMGLPWKGCFCGFISTFLSKAIKLSQCSKQERSNLAGLCGTTSAEIQNVLKKRAGA